MTNTQSSISGTVRDPNGQPVSDARVYFIEGPVPFPDVALLTDSNGAFTLTAPAPGTYMIGCTANGFEPIIVTVNVSKGQNVQVEIKLAE
jgi:hypothetical protein